MNKIKLTTCIILITTTLSFGQDPYVGTFLTTDGNFQLSIQEQQQTYWGTINYGQMVFNLSGTMQNDRLVGMLAMQGQLAQPSRFEAIWHNNFLYLTTANANIYIFKKQKNSASPLTQAPTNNNYQQRQNNQQNTGSGGQAFNRISGSKLYIYTSSSSVLSSSSSSYSEIDFCPNGYFKDYSEASTYVQGGNYDYNTGTYDAGAGAASSGNYNGSWSIGNGALILQYGNGQTASYDLNEVLSGSWQRGRTKFAMDWNKGSCR